jgi:hypothetical protein
MIRSYLVWTAALLTVAVACLTRTHVRAADGPGSGALKKHGLRIAGTLAVADEEAEIKTKLTEARRLSKQLSNALVQQKGTMSPQEQQRYIKNGNDQINQLKSEMNAANQQMNAIPKFRGRFMSTDASQLYAQLVNYRNQLQMEINQDSLFLNQLKNQPADPRAKEKIDAEVSERRDAYHQAVLDLRKLVDAADAKYKDAAENDDVKKALVVAGKGLREKVKLGPSHDFLANVKLVEKLERADASGESEQPSATKTRRGHGRTTLKSSSKAAPAQEPEAAGKSDGAASP